MNDKINDKLDEEYKWLKETPYSKNETPDIIDILKDKCIASNAALRRALEALKSYRVSPIQSLREHAEACERDIAKILGVEP